MFRDHRFHLDPSPTFQEYVRTHRPPTLITWMPHDEIFGADGAPAYLRDHPAAEPHLLEGSPFALKRHGTEIASPTRGLPGRHPR